MDIVFIERERVKKGVALPYDERNPLFIIIFCFSFNVKYLGNKFN